ncbi:MAG: hypothetical protein JSR73_13455 [Proteobacteria bacterium]|nr:hypothetical protein [Pseudomonadota bacterium]
MSARHALLAALAAAAPLVAAAPAADRPAFITAYDAPATREYLVYRDQMREARVLESVAEELNRALELPATVTLRLAECGHSSTRWDAATRSVVVCYEFLDAVLVIAGSDGAADERGEQRFSAAVTFALLTEVGRALTELFRLPAAHGSGRAGEDFATVTIAAADRDDDRTAGAVVDFLELALREPDSGFEYLEDRGFDRARLTDVACALYGNSPTTHPDFLVRGLVPPERAARCAEELLALAKAWELALHDHVRGAAAAR